MQERRSGAGREALPNPYMSHSLNSLKEGYIGDYLGTTIGLIKGDTRSLDYSSYELNSLKGFFSQTVMEGIIEGGILGV